MTKRFNVAMLASTLVAGAASAQEAHLTPSAVAASVPNVRFQQTIGGKVGAVGCLPTSCRITFAVPAGRRLVIQHVAVDYALNSASFSTSAYLLLSTATGGSAQVAIPVQSLGGARYYAGGPTTAFTESSNPQIIVYGSGFNPSYVVRATIVGTLE